VLRTASTLGVLVVTAALSWALLPVDDANISRRDKHRKFQYRNRQKWRNRRKRNSQHQAKRKRSSGGYGRCAGK
ncbi:hypothetical protein ACFV28_33715, partial [Streptomyces sp. NPDC059720]